MPEFGPGRINEVPDCSAILCQDDLPMGVIDLLNDAGHGGTHRPSSVRIMRHQRDDEGQHEKM